MYVRESDHAIIMVCKLASRESAAAATKRHMTKLYLAAVTGLGSAHPDPGSGILSEMKRHE